MQTRDATSYSQQALGDTRDKCAVALLSRLPVRNANGSLQKFMVDIEVGLHSPTAITGIRTNILERKPPITIKLPRSSA